MAGRAGSRGSILTYAVVLLGTSAISAVLMLTSTSTSSAMPASSPPPTMSADMPGMDHGSAAMPASSPSPTSPAHVHGAAPGSADVPASSPSPGPAHEHGTAPGSPDVPASSMSPTSPAHEHGTDGSDVPGTGFGHGKTAGPSPERPLAAVLGTFGGASSAVLLSAGFLRRNDRARNQAKQTARAARRTRK